MCFINWRTSAADVDEIVALLVRLGAEIANGTVIPTIPDVPTTESGGTARST